MIQGILYVVGGLFKAWNEKRTARHQAELQRIAAEGKVALTKAESGGMWELIQARQAERSLKDELWTVFFVGAMTLAMIPATQPAVLTGLQTLGEAPVWIQAGAMASIAASFGLRQVFAKWLGK